MKIALRLLLLAALGVAGLVSAVEPGTAPLKPADAPAPKFKRVLPETPPGVTLLMEELAKYPEHTVELLVYVPDRPGVYPAILDIHGGGWEKRQIENDRPMMERLASRGFVTALVSYRLSGEAKYPAALHDCKAAVRYLRANAARFKIDPDHIGVMGGSAGGHLSGLLAMTSGKPEFDGEGPSREAASGVQACIVMAATQDLVAANKDKTGPGSIAFFGGSCSDLPDLYVQASPITHVRSGVPPTIFIEGEKDSLKVGRAEMQEKLRGLGIETAVHTLKDAPHPFWMSQPWLGQTVDIAAEFFARQLGKPNEEIAVRSGEKIAFLGDSITAGGAATPSGYVRLVISGLEANGVQATAIGAGISGHKSDQMLERLERDVISKKPDWMTLSCGVNDVWHGPKGIPLEQYKQNIAAIVDKAQAAGIKVVILTATMIHEDAANDNNKKLAAYNDFLRELARQKNCRLADLNADMQAAVAVPAGAPPRRGNLLTSDGVHMNPRGNQMMAAGVLKTLGSSNAQLQKARDFWLDVPKAVELSAKAGVSLRQYEQLSKLAESQNKSVQDLVNGQVDKAVEALLKPAN